MSDTPSTQPTRSPPGHLAEPLPNLAAWKDYFLNAEIPVLASTASAIEALRDQEEDDVDAARLAEVIEQDPLMMVKVFAYVAKKRRGSAMADQETIISALVMTGVAPFFRDFGLQPTVEDHLRAYPAAMEGINRLLVRANRAAHFATGFAVHRADRDVQVIRQAAFLHDFSEMLMWCYAPTMEIEIHAMQRSNPTLRSANLQRFIFNIELSDLRQELMKEWHFPELLVRISDSHHADHPIVRNVLLAVRLARHTENGWDNAALPDDIADIAKLLNANERAVRGFVYKIDQARQTETDGA